MFSSSKKKSYKKDLILLKECDSLDLDIEDILMQLTLQDDIEYGNVYKQQQKIAEVQSFLQQVESEIHEAAEAYITHNQYLSNYAQDQQVHRTMEEYYQSIEKDVQTIIDRAYDDFHSNKTCAENCNPENTIIENNSSEILEKAPISSIEILIQSQQNNNLLKISDNRVDKEITNPMKLNN